MRNTMKIAISIPKEDYYKIEKIRKKLGFVRSVLIDKAVKFWIEHQEQQQLIRRYKEGYRNTPEDIHEIKAMEDGLNNHLPLERVRLFYRWRCKPFGRILLKVINSVQENILRNFPPSRQILPICSYSLTKSNWKN